MLAINDRVEIWDPRGVKVIYRGTVHYFNGEWVGIQIDGESQVHEWPVSRCDPEGSGEELTPTDVDGIDFTML